MKLHPSRRLSSLSSQAAVPSLPLPHSVLSTALLLLESPLPCPTPTTYVVRGEGEGWRLSMYQQGAEVASTPLDHIQHGYATSADTLPLGSGDTPPVPSTGGRTFTQLTVMVHKYRGPSSFSAPLPLSALLCCAFAGSCRRTCAA